MRLKNLFGIVATWVAAISVAHLAVNVDWSEWRNARLPRDQRKFHVAYIPVT